MMAYSVQDNGAKRKISHRRGNSSNERDGVGDGSDGQAGKKISSSDAVEDLQTVGQATCEGADAGNRTARAGEAAQQVGTSKSSHSADDAANWVAAATGSTSKTTGEAAQAASKTTESASQAAQSAAELTLLVAFGGGISGRSLLPSGKSDVWNTNSAGGKWKCSQSIQNVGGKSSVGYWKVGTSSGKGLEDVSELGSNLTEDLVSEALDDLVNIEIRRDDGNVARQNARWDSRSWQASGWQVGQRARDDRRDGSVGRKACEGGDDAGVHERNGGWDNLGDGRSGKAGLQDGWEGERRQVRNGKRNVDGTWEGDWRDGANVWERDWKVSCNTADIWDRYWQSGSGRRDCSSNR